MLRKFLITGGIAVIVFVGVSIVFALSSWMRIDIPDWLGAFLYITAFYVAPAALVAAFIGSLVCIIKSRLGK